MQPELRRRLLFMGVMEPAAFVMTRRMLQRMTQRAEALSTAPHVVLQKR